VSEPTKAETADRAREVLGLLVATAQVSNMILARGVAGSVPPFSIAFFRWSIVALGLLPAVVMALRQSPGLLRKDGFGIALAGFLRHVHLRRTGLSRRRDNFGHQHRVDHGAVAACRTAVFLRLGAGGRRPAKRSSGCWSRWRARC